MSHKDYYKVLGVPRDAPMADIKKKYRALAKRFHPDTHPGDREAEARFKDVSEAYEVLGDEAKRRKYDELLRLGFDPAGGFRRRGGRGAQGAQGFEELFKEFGGDGFSDLFEKLFGGRGGATGEPSPAPARGEDVEIQAAIGFREAVKGGFLKLRFPRRAPCDACSGTGARPGVGLKTCPRCRGEGRLQAGQGAFSIKRTCPACMGRGKVVDEPCGICGGEGSVATPRELRVRIPPGAVDGQRLRVDGEGHRGRGGAAGNLVVTLRVKGDPAFERRGDDLLTRVEVTLGEALLGARKTVPTPGGDVAVSVPAGVQPGTKLKLRGLGVAREQGAGDLLVEVVVRLPRRLPPGAAEALAKLEREWEY